MSQENPPIKKRKSPIWMRILPLSLLEKYYTGTGMDLAIISRLGKPYIDGPNAYHTKAYIGSLATSTEKFAAEYQRRGYREIPTTEFERADTGDRKINERYLRIPFVNESMQIPSKGS